MKNLKKYFPRESKSGTPKLNYYINFPLQVKYLSHIKIGLNEPKYSKYK